MKVRFIFSFFFFLGLLTAFSPTFLAQESKSPQQISVEPLGENESLPFMHSEKASSSDEPSSAGLLLKTLGSMIFIIGLIFVGAWGAKKLGYGNSKATSESDSVQLSVLTSVSLSNNRTISAIRFGSRVLLVGSTPQSFTLLGEESDELTEQTTPRSVAELLAEDGVNFDAELRSAESRLNSFIPGRKIS